MDQPALQSNLAQAADQLLVVLKRTVVGIFPANWQPIVSMLVSISAIIAVFGLLFALAVLAERKGLGRLQNRYGPNRVGPFGILQPIADGIKMLIKEDLVPRAADRVVHFLAPIALVVPVLLAYSVLPMGRNMVVVDVDVGVLLFFAMGAATELAVFMAGWAGRNKYSMLGAMRAIAQMISYEVVLIIASVAVVMITGSMSLVDIVTGQGGYHWGWLARWHVFTPWGLAGLALFVIAAAAECNRTPFDIPEGESEIIAGHLVEYSGFKYALFFMGEYFGMFAISGLAITLFLGGWQAPFSFLAWVPSYIWFFTKLSAFICLFIWLRGTLPRLRMDQLMAFAWKFLLPMVLVNLLVTGLWHMSGRLAFPGAVAVRWLVCALMVGIPYLVLSRALFGDKLRPRTYRYA